MKNCSDCKYAVWQEYGYSNWTVEGTDFSCANKLHPEGSFDRFYNVNPKLEYAQQCPGFVEGEGICMDVEHEGVANLTPEQKIIWGSV
ncbi:MAG: hypothetical protein ACXW1D_00145 [Halobacteriota archaeon]